MFGIVNKLKTFKEVLKQKLSETVDDLIDDGYDAEQTEDDEIEIKETEDYDSKDIDNRIDEDFPSVEEEDEEPNGASWLPIYFKFRHMEDHRVCADCRNFGDTYVHKLELRRDGTGNLHMGGDEDIIKFLLKDSAYTVEDLANQPQSVSLNLHASQKDEPEYILSCRCFLALVT